MSDDFLADLAGRIAVLEMQVGAQGRILTALALAVPQPQRAALSGMRAGRLGFDQRGK